MDKFEQFFRENRLRLDTEDFENATWKQIGSSFKKQKRKVLFRRIYMAASILIIATLGSVLFLLNRNENQPVKQTSIFAKYSPDLAEQEISYIQLIKAKVDSINSEEIPAENAQLFNEFIKQLDVIDKQYELYKSKIEAHGYNEELIQQIIYNYQLKLSVLQMLQSEIEKINRLTKQKKNEKQKIKINI